MKLQLVVVITSLMTCTSAIADTQSFYCPQNTRYINVGMTPEEVIAACGQPLSKQESNMAATEKVPVQQLVYTALNTGSIYPGLNPAFFQTWSLGSGSSGISFTVSIIDNKVSGININGSDTNAMSMCGGTSIQSGDNISKVYNACGQPASVNQTYLEKVIPNSTKPEVWIYQLDRFHQPVSLTFVNGKLQSIN